MSTLLAVALLAALFAVATRYARDLTSLGVAAAVAAGVLFVHYEWAGVAYALAWATWVWASWRVVEPVTPPAINASYAWHGMAAVAMCLAAAVAGHHVAAALVWFSVFALFAAALDGWHASLVLDESQTAGAYVAHPGHLVLWLSGGAWGAAMALVA